MPIGAEHLVTGEGVEIAAKRLHVDLHVRSGLSTVNQDWNITRVREFDNLFYGLTVPRAF